MATYSSNTTIKTNAAISVARTSTGTFYTAPATGYGIANVFVSSFGSGTISVTVGTRVVFTATGVSTLPVTIYIGPSQAVACTISATAQVDLSGVEFLNTP